MIIKIQLDKIEKAKEVMTQIADHIENGHTGGLCNDCFWEIVGKNQFSFVDDEEDV
jgi:hypothetical protein